MKMASRLATLGLLALMVTAISAPTASAATSPFTGSWTSIDTDGSIQYLTFTGGTRVHGTYVDLGGSICVNNGSPTNVFQANLQGMVDGNVAEGDFVFAHCGPVFFDVGGFFIEYDPATDTLFDGSITWTRIR
jgi:hypothetical protein